VAAVLAGASERMDVTLSEWDQPWLPSWYENHRPEPVRVSPSSALTVPVPVKEGVPTPEAMDALVNEALSRMHSDAFMVYYLKEGAKLHPFDSSFNGYPHLLMVYLSVRRAKVPGADRGGFSTPPTDTRPWADQLATGSLIPNLRPTTLVLLRRWLVLNERKPIPTRGDLARLATQVELPTALVAAWLSKARTSFVVPDVTLFDEMLQLFPQETPPPPLPPPSRVLSARVAFASPGRHDGRRSEGEAAALAAVACPDRLLGCGVAKCLCLSRTRGSGVEGVFE
jgi:hypothetical protein